MNRDYEIYQALASEIPEEDKARLDGYLRGRAEAVHLARSQSPKFASSISTKKKKRKRK